MHLTGLDPSSFPLRIQVWAHDDGQRDTLHTGLARWGWDVSESIVLRPSTDVLIVMADPEVMTWLTDAPDRPPVVAVILEGQDLKRHTRRLLRRVDVIAATPTPATLLSAHGRYPVVRLPTGSLHSLLPDLAQVVFRAHAFTSRPRAFGISGVRDP